MSELVNFEQLDVQISDYIKGYPLEQQREILEYLNDMDEFHKKAYRIAFDHLKTSFNITRSNGFKEWIQSKKAK